MTETLAFSEVNTRSRNLWVRIVGAVLAAVVFAASVVLYAPVLSFGRNFLILLLFAAVSAAIFAGTWSTLIHGDLKQRSDFAVAMATAIVLLALGGLAGQLYGPDWVASKSCSLAASMQSVDCTDSVKLVQHNLNAVSLEQMFGLLVVGQIVPLLSIFKDAVYCWIKPTPWYELRKDQPDASSVRRANRRGRKIPTGQ